MESTIHCLPPEIHNTIISFACSSPSPSNPAHSLSLVSRYFHALSNPHRFASVTVTSSERIALLLSALEKAPAHERRVRRLFVSDRPSEGSEIDGDDEDSNISHDPDTSTIHLRTLERLLALASFTLHTLTLHIHNPYTSTSLLSRVWTTHFPVLDSLTVSGLYPLPTSLSQGPNEEHAIQQAYTPLPRLRALHLHGMRNPSGLFDLGGLDAVCPNLEYLRISGIAAAKSFAEEIGMAIKARRDEVDAGQRDGHDRNRMATESVRSWGLGDEIERKEEAFEESRFDGVDALGLPISTVSHLREDGLSLDLSSFSPFTPHLPPHLAHVTLSIPSSKFLPPRCGARFERMHAEMATLLETLPKGGAGLDVEIVRESKEDTQRDGYRLVRRLWECDA